MIAKFDPRYRFHNQHTLKDNIIRKLEVKLVVQQIPGKVALTSDMWTASNSSSFLSLTIHYVDSSWKLKNFLLDIIPIEVQHNGYNMTNAIMEVLCKFIFDDIFVKKKIINFGRMDQWVSKTHRSVCPKCFLL